MIEFEKLIIIKIDENKDYGRFVIELLECGYGIILGNFFCCVFLFLFLGVVVILIKIDGVLYEFDIILGVCEDVM